MDITPHTTFVAELLDFTPGLVGTVGVRIENADGSTHTARTTAGIVEVEPGSGDYTATLTSPDDQGSYVILWDDGAAAPDTLFASEELVVTYSLAGAASIYTTVDDVRGALAPGGTDTRAGETAASLSDTELEDAIQEAGELVDARLGERYSTPFTPPYPPLISQIARDLAAYGATLTNRKGQPLNDRHPVQLRYDQATDLLDKLSSGSAVIDTGDEEAAPGSTAVVNVIDGSLFDPWDFGLASPTQPPFDPEHWRVSR
jgi:phage gp36-like protein